MNKFIPQCERKKYEIFHKYSKAGYFSRSGIIEERLGVDEKLLDVGCGGGFARRLYQKGFNDVTLVDYDHYVQYDVPYQFFKVDVCLYRFPFNDNTFDSVTANGVFEHLENPYCC